MVERRSVLAQCNAFIEEGQIPEAISRLQRLYEVDSGHLGALKLLVKAHYRAGDGDAAHRVLAGAGLIELESHTFFSNLTPDSIILDLGGWRGNFAAFLNEGFGCRLHIVEPHRLFCSMLRDRFADSPNVRVHEVAIGGYDGVAPFFPSPDHFTAEGKGSSLLAESPYVDRSVSYEVKQQTLSSFVTELDPARIDLIKMDIEGAEIRVLDHAGNAPVWSMTQALTIEFHHRMPILSDPFLSEEKVHKAIDLLKGQGFQFLDFSRDIPYIDCLFYRSSGLA